MNSFNKIGDNSGSRFFQIITGILFGLVGFMIKVFDKSGNLPSQYKVSQSLWESEVRDGFCLLS